MKAKFQCVFILLSDSRQVSRTRRWSLVSRVEWMDDSCHAHHSCSTHGRGRRQGSGCTPSGCLVCPVCPECPACPVAVPRTDCIPRLHASLLQAMQASMAYHTCMPHSGLHAIQHRSHTMPAGFTQDYRPWLPYTSTDMDIWLIINDHKLMRAAILH